ncbi:hypothetical protein SDC9_160567 [bioreactor metagenome]|uniref:Uncharacterized protein n=1 Tax=bioreactor metagenome TaxID=1076179 RepID=A0A645FHZ7_9ZZZZ
MVFDPLETFPRVGHGVGQGSFRRSKTAPQLNKEKAGIAVRRDIFASRAVPAQPPSVIVSFIPLLLFFNYASLRWGASEKGWETTIMAGADFEIKFDVLCKCFQ